VPAILKLDEKLIAAPVKLGHFRSKRSAVNAALHEFVHRRTKLRIIELQGKIDFDPEWDYKKLRRHR